MPIELLPIKLLIVSLVVFFSFSATGSDDVPASAEVPIVVVHAQRAVETTEVEAIAKGLGAPYVRGKALKGRLGIVVPLSEGFAKGLEAQFKKAQDEFFSGQQEAAKNGFSDIIAKANANPTVVLTPSRTRKLVFKAHIYRAIVSHGDKNDELVDKQLAVAARSFLDLTPGTIDFPPWIRKRFDQVRQEITSGFGTIELDVPKDCELEFLGKKYTSGQSVEKVESGDYALNVVCKQKISPTQRIFVSDKKIVYRPVVLGHSTFGEDEDDLVLRVEGEVTKSGIIQDLLSITRSGGWDRLVGVIGHGTGNQTEIVLIDSHMGGSVRDVVIPSGDMEQYAVAADDLAWGLSAMDDDARTGSMKPWYKDGLAWTLVGTGLAIFGAGIAVAQIYSSPSRQEELAWPLIVAGAGTLGTGALLFFIPVEREIGSDESKTGVAFGISGRVTF